MAYPNIDVVRPGRRVSRFCRMGTYLYGGHYRYIHTRWVRLDDIGVGAAPIIYRCSTLMGYLAAASRDASS